MLLYAFDHHATVGKPLLKTCGLTGRLEGSILERQSMSGPGGVACVLASVDTAAAGDLAFAPDKQSWQRSVCGRFWVGLWNERRTTEPMLRRRVQVPGHRVRLDDGGDWQIPLARVFPVGSLLPRTLVMTSSGMAEKISPRFAAFSQQAERLWQKFMTDVDLAIGDTAADETISPAEQWDLCAEALAINYRVGIDEINLLGLFTTHNLEEIGAAIVDVPTLKAVLEEKVKKKQPPSPAE